MHRWMALFLALLPASLAPAAEPADFSGTWSSTYGPLTLRQTGDRVVGQYQLEETSGLVEGTVDGRKLTFTYRESNASGEGWFELAADGSSFDGRWREKGKTEWSRWTGTSGRAQAGRFDGIWNSTYGPLQLQQTGNTAQGFYRMADGRFASVSGTVSGTEFSFSYDECGVKGTGVFTLGADGHSFSGTWKTAEGEPGTWTGIRLEPKPGRIWLVVLEARWEESLTEREYAYGSMLEAYFARTPNVECRHRFFDDADSLLRACSEIPFLPEPVVVVIASHGSEEGISSSGRTIGAATLAECFARARNVKLLHFSACSVMAETLPAEMAKALPKSTAFPMSGYATAVDWGASAATEFLYLDLVLARDMEPDEAARQLLKLLPIAGDRGTPDAPFDPLGFRFVKKPAP